jgi:hypothetical protein
LFHFFNIDNWPPQQAFQWQLSTLKKRFTKKRKIKLVFQHRSAIVPENLVDSIFTNNDPSPTLPLEGRGTLYLAILNGCICEILIVKLSAMNSF